LILKANDGCLLLDVYGVIARSLSESTVDRIGSGAPSSCLREVD